MSESLSISASSATFSVAGMDCASCVGHVEKAARGVDGVNAARVNLARGRAVVEFDPEKTTPAAVADAITHSGYPAHAETVDDGGANAEERRVAEQSAHARAWFRRAIVAIALWFPVESLHWLLKVTGSHGDEHLWVIWLALLAS